MAGQNLGPSPNWYSSKVSDCNKNGIFAYGSRGNIVLMDVTLSPPVYIEMFSAHADRVSAVSFCRNMKKVSWLVSCADDKKVKIFDTANRMLLYEQVTHQKVTCLDWRGDRDDIAFIGGDKGFLAAWDLHHETIIRYQSASSTLIFCLTSCISKPELLAVGFKGGLVVIHDVSKEGKVIFILRSHGEDVMSLSWSRYTEAGKSIPQLASSSRDRTLRVWDVTEEKPLHVINIPHQRGGRADEQNKARHWFALCWMLGKQNCLICTTVSGDVMLCDVEKQTWKHFSTTERGGHSRCVFNICLVGGESEIACTVSLDRQIVIWDLESMKSKYVLPTLGGFAYTVVANPLDPGRLAVGAGDNMVRVWTLTGVNPYHTVSLWQKIQGKVKTISWHPEREAWLAYGTDDGHVGVLDTLSSNRSQVLTSPCHRQIVYNVCWGPCFMLNKGDQNGRPNLFLYSCGDGVILIHNVDKPKEEKHNFNTLTANSGNLERGKGPVRTELAWKADYSVLAVGNEDGSVDIYHGQDFHIIARLKAQKKLIQCIRWHLQFTAVSSQQSTYHCFLACSSNENEINIYDLTSVLGENNNTRTCEVTITQPTIQLAGHQFRVTSLAWSPHVDCRLASVSYDGTVQIWDVLTGTPVANFAGHRGRVFCVEWNPLDPDLVFSGGEDFTIQQWRVSQQENILPPPKKRTRKKKSTKSQRYETTSEDVQGLNDSTVLKELDQLLEIKKQELQNPSQKEMEINSKIMDVLSTQKKEETVTDSLTVDSKEKEDPVHATPKLAVDSDSDTSMELCQSLKKQADVSKEKSVKSMERKKKKPVHKSHFPVSAALENRGKHFSCADCLHLVDHLYPAKETCLSSSLSSDVEPSKPQEQDKFTHLGFFTDRHAMLDLLITEGVKHRENGNLDLALQQELWIGNVGPALREAAEKRQLSDWLVALAPLGSRTLWLEMCEKYAQQLAENQKYHRASLYLLACHKVYEAIDVLKDHNLFREALAIARSRLPSVDPTLNDILCKWAARADKEGNYEMAAKCYLAVSDPEAAAKTMAKRCNPPSLRIAAYISRRCHQPKEADGYVKACFKESLIRSDWITAGQITRDHPHFQPYLLVSSLHERLTKELEKLSQDIGSNSSILPENFNDSQPVIWKGHVQSGESFFTSILTKWKEDELLQDWEHVDVICQVISELFMKKQPPYTQQELLFQISIHFTLFLLREEQRLTDTSSASFKHLTTALSLANSQKFPDKFHFLCRLIFSKELKWDSSRIATVRGIHLLKPNYSAVNACLNLEELWHSELPLGVHLTLADLPDSSDEKQLSELNSADVLIENILQYDSQEFFEKVWVCKTVIPVLAFFSVNWLSQLDKFIERTEDKNLNLCRFLPDVLAHLTNYLLCDIFVLEHYLHDKVKAVENEIALQKADQHQKTKITCAKQKPGPYKFKKISNYSFAGDEQKSIKENTFSCDSKEINITNNSFNLQEDTSIQNAEKTVTEDTSKCLTQRGKTGAESHGLCSVEKMDESKKDTVTSESLGVCSVEKMDKSKKETVTSESLGVCSVEKMDESKKETVTSESLGVCSVEKTDESKQETVTSESLVCSVEKMDKSKKDTVTSQLLGVCSMENMDELKEERVILEGDGGQKTFFIHKSDSQRSSPLSVSSTITSVCELQEERIHLLEKLKDLKKLTEEFPFPNPHKSLIQVKEWCSKIESLCPEAECHQKLKELSNKIEVWSQHYVFSDKLYTKM
ncbi:gem-associated protein 5-like isoform X2 [Limulus polyphemus]|uniref:Gem-associated protein 5-like isoform X2 n=1 Tax=Limulus polyphemus TaxID=6850 RepID=A0ABM1SD08_LIMPO|nr:gem-associated protein 5-like isoform X2 [Limulus polyphemus]